MNTLEPTEEQLKELSAGPEGPVVMVNLLRYKRDAEGNKVGLEEWAKYTEGVTPMLLALGGKPIWGGRLDSVFIGSTNSEWDTVLLVEYPSREAFLGMISSPEYLEIHQHRLNALESAGLIATTPGVLS